MSMFHYSQNQNLKNYSRQSVSHSRVFALHLKTGAENGTGFSKNSDKICPHERHELHNLGGNRQELISGTLG
ncbi:hypothetical protein B6D60_08330 [candidate division KSB1 bacterium 4484_87]|nr:MAG: hypothetical protein B6D60_08330 [candidate division KSB1 bacterium 4484_87]